MLVRGATPRSVLFSVSSVGRQSRTRLLPATVRMVHTEERIKELGYTLPDMPVPLASYVPVVRTGEDAHGKAHAPRSILKGAYKHTWLGLVDDSESVSHRCVTCHM